MSTTQCPSCGNHVHPRLWHYEPAIVGYVTYPRTQHICNVCGAVMYETGGGIRKGRALALLAGFSPIIAAFAALKLGIDGGAAQYVVMPSVMAAIAVLPLGLCFLTGRWVLRTFFSQRPKIQTTPTPNARRPVISDSKVESLERLAALKEKGILSEDEFQNEKKKLLST